MRIEVVQRADEHEEFAADAFAADAFAAQVGESIPFTVNGYRQATCRLVEAVVSGDGGEVRLTFDVPPAMRGWVTMGRVVYRNGPFLALPVPQWPEAWPPAAGPHLDVSLPPATPAWS